MLRFRWSFFTAMLALAATVVGCSAGSDPRAASVSGTVTLDGEPLVGAEVHFATDKFEGYGKTDSKGHYELIAGALPGSNKVYFRKLDSSDSPSGMDVAPGEGGEVDRGQVEAFLASKAATGELPKSGVIVIPPEYSDPQNSKLTFTVPSEGTSNADFKLTTSK